MRTFVILVVAALVGLAAYAVIFTERHSSYTSRAYGVSESIWGQVCGGKTPNLVTRHFDGDIAGNATWAYTEFPDGSRIYTKCEIAIDDRPWDVHSARYCAVIVHEWGHLKLETRQHSSDPDSIMYYRLSRRNIPERC